MTSELNGAAATMPTTAVAGQDEILRVEDLKVHFPVTRRIVVQRQVGTVKAVDGVCFALAPRRDARAWSAKAAAASRPRASPSCACWSRPPAASCSRARTSRPTTRSACGRSGDACRWSTRTPMGSLNPRMKVRDIVGEPLEVHGVAGDRAAYRDRVDGADRPGRPAPRHGRALSARILRRPAPAHRHRPRARARTRASSSATSRCRRSTCRSRRRS